MVATNDDLLAELQAIKRQLKRLNEKENLKFDSTLQANLNTQDGNIN